MPRNKLDFAQIRRTAIAALFSDDVLTEYLVLKGGNALNLIYGITSRTSLDLDFSMSEDFKDPVDARARVFASLRDRFDASGYVLFDERFAARPPIKGVDDKPWWGGYEISFKLIEREKYQSLKNRPGKLSVNALVIGGGEQRSFNIDFSKWEYTDGRAEHEIDHFTVFVYTPAMIAAEKIRAICQQMAEYPHTGNKRPRARDFYDIYQVLTTCNIDLATPENKSLTKHMFDAKKVPLTLIANIAREREFHRPDWASVIHTTTGELHPYDFYFDFVVSQTDRLKALWME